MIEVKPGSQPANGARRYSYNVAGQLVKVETHDGSSYQTQAEMSYNGQAQRLAMTAYQDGQSLSSHYVLDGNDPLAATASGQTTCYLPRLGEKQQGWSCFLPDDTGTVRQVADAGSKPDLVYLIYLVRLSG